MRFTVNHIPSTDSWEVTSPDLPDWRKVAVGRPGLAEQVLAGLRAMAARGGHAGARWDNNPTPTAAGPARITVDDVLEIPLSQMFVDAAYQRPLDKRRVAKMAADFDPALIGVLEVSERPAGQFAIVDGQHRWALLHEVRDETDDPPVACKVHRGLSLDEEAALFSDIDASRRSLTGWDRWCARRGAGDPVVLEVEAAIEACGLKTGRLTQTGVVRTTGTCEQIYDVGGASLLTEVLQLCVNVWDKDPEALVGSILGGFALVLRIYPEPHGVLDLDRLVRQLQPRTVRQIYSLIATKRERTKGEAATLAAAVFVDLYNAADRSGRLDPTLVQKQALSRPLNGPATVRTRDCPDCGGPIVKKHTRGRWPSRCVACRDERRAGRAA